MKLYVCSMADLDLPGPVKVHSCTKAMKALDAAGHSYERVEVKGGRMLPWTMKGNRDEVEALSGQKLVPILVLDDGAVITSSGKIISWAKANATS